MAFGGVRRKLRRYARCCVLAAAVLVAAQAPGHAEPSGLPHADDELVIGVPETITALHPLVSTLYERFVLGFAHRRLAIPDQSWHLTCSLCTALPSLANGRIKLVPAPGGGQGAEVSYTLQPQARWADGEPVTSQDVVFSAEIERLPDSGLPNAVLFRNLRNVRVVDASNFVMVFDHVQFGLSTPDAFEILPEHIEGPIFRGLADKRDYLKHSAYRTTPTSPGLWMGPYRLAEFGAGKYAVFERNPYWFGEAPYFRKITLRFYPSSAQAQAGLFAGETDFLQEGTLPLSVAADIKSRLRDSFEVKTAPGASLLNVVVNLDHPQLKDERVRRALLLAIDRKAIAAELLGDEQAVAHSFLPPQDPGYSNSIPHVPFDPAAAAQSLRDAGYQQNPAGHWLDPAGAPLALRLSINAGNSLTGPVGDRLTAAWRRLGIDVTLVSDLALLAQTLPHRRFDLAMFSLTATPEYVPQTVLSSAAIPTEGNNYSGQNYAGLKNPEIDGLLAALTGETDGGKRQGLWAKLQLAWAQNLPALPLFDLPQLYVVPNWLRGFAPTGHLIPSSDFAETWSRRS
jgi:peptide/nickel transport system substrate-binding protein